MRLNAYIAKSQGVSRRVADRMIKDGYITVNGYPAKLHMQIELNDKVEYMGSLAEEPPSVYILFNKPPGCVTTLKDPQGRKTVADYVDIGQRVFPVGRLDYDTTGILILTNDGDFAHKMMHPKHGIDKVYEATIKGQIRPEMLEQLRKGVEIDGGRTSPAKVRKISGNKVELTIHEGRKHQVKKMLAAVGLPVISLHRSVYAGIGLEGLKPGQWRELTAQEIKMLE